MQHLATYPIKNGLRCTWLPAPDFASKDSTRVLGLDFARTVIGVAYEPRPLFTCVVAERVLPGGPGKTPVRLFVILEDAEESVPQNLFKKLIELKDKYRCSTVLAPKVPLSDTLRDEGLTHYVEDYPEVLGRRQWPTYVDSDTVAGLFLQEVPDKTRIDREIEARLAKMVENPKTGLTMQVEGKPVPELYVPADFPNKASRAGLRRSLQGPTTAIWYAVEFLSRSFRPPVKRNQEWERVGDQKTGY